MFGQSKLTLGLGIALVIFTVKTILSAFGIEIPDFGSPTLPAEHPFN
jgi:hypothetical protein